MTTIQLNDGWETEHDATGTRFRCRFTLEPLDWCASYWLHVSAPMLRQVRLRATLVDSADDVAFLADVTNLLTLDDNALELAFASSETTLAPGAVWLEAVPCDEV